MIRCAGAVQRVLRTVARERLASGLFYSRGSERGPAETADKLKQKVHDICEDTRGTIETTKRKEEITIDKIEQAVDNELEHLKDLTVKGAKDGETTHDFSKLGANWRLFPGSSLRGIEPDKAAARAAEIESQSKRMYEEGDENRYSDQKNEEGDVRH